MSIKESNTKKNYSNQSNTNKKIASTASFYLKNIIRDTDSRAHKGIKKIKPLYLKGRELATNFKTKT